MNDGATAGAGGAQTRWRRRNLHVTAWLAALLVVSGVLGFVVPERLAPMSGATAYNLFHLAAGLVAGAAALSRRPALAAAFNLGFGLFDLWQVPAGALALFPAGLFALRPADHVVHALVGAPLALLGALGLRAGAGALEAPGLREDAAA